MRIIGEELNKTGKGKGLVDGVIRELVFWGEKHEDG